MLGNRGDKVLRHESGQQYDFPAAMECRSHGHIHGKRVEHWQNTHCHVLRTGGHSSLADLRKCVLVRRVFNWLPYCFQHLERIRAHCRLANVGHHVVVRQHDSLRHSGRSRGVGQRAHVGEDVDFGCFQTGHGAWAEHVVHRPTIRGNIACPNVLAYCLMYLHLFCTYPPPRRISFPVATEHLSSACRRFCQWPPAWWAAAPAS